MKNLRHYIIGFPFGVSITFQGVISTSKHSRCKKGTETGLAEKEVKSNGQSRPPGFDRLESFDHDEFTAKHCYFRCSRPPDVDGIKIFDKDNQAAKHLRQKDLNALRPGHLYQKVRSS